MIYLWQQEMIWRNIGKRLTKSWNDWPSWTYICSQENVNSKSNELNSWELYWKTARLLWTQSKSPELRTGRLPEMSRKSVKSWDFGISIGDLSRGSHTLQDRSITFSRRERNGSG